MKPILVVGSVNLDMVASSERIPAPGETLIGNHFETFFGGKGANQAVEMGYRKKIPVMLDPAPARELPPKLLLQLSWLTPNESETLALCGSSPAHGPGSLPLDPTHVRQHAEDLLGRGPRHVILKLGSQ